jgi:hypothetical protein
MDHTNNTSNISNSVERKSINGRSGSTLLRRKSFVKHDTKDGLDIYHGPFILDNLFTIPA